MRTRSLGGGYCHERHAQRLPRRLSFPFRTVCLPRRPYCPPLFSKPVPCSRSTITPVTHCSRRHCTTYHCSSTGSRVHSYLLSPVPIVHYMYIRPVLRYLETSVSTSCLQVSLAVFSLVSYSLNTSCLQPDCRALLRSRCTSARRRPCSSRKPPP